MEINQHMPVFFHEEPQLKGMFTCAWVDIYKSWDGSLYAETNVKGLAGPNQFVQSGNYREVAKVNHQRVNSPASFKGYWF